MSCPICNKEADAKYRPFCSRRCADVDLGRWLRGSYAIPAEPLDEGDPPAGPQDDADPASGARPH
ncbi:DNA gyrase inhibitor YacG [Paragemmobacter ruber]|uniref:DNA gyrase inhibitor YacG n=1 Tax=Paragemmobacter ruber TaxID=1985673 RepID=A0ABW9Y235_9RHOB|nr:DNA gyrase inhibitor YacG [Rhodobacter ruber]NBE06453.1 DNA gyrase inhibitor YacG [Rhodobacter ruber]